MVVFEGITWKLICVTITEIYAIGVIDVMIKQMYAVLLEMLDCDLQLPMELIVSATTILFLVVIIYAMHDKMQGYINRIPIGYYIVFICLDTGNGILLGGIERNLAQGNMGLRVVLCLWCWGFFSSLLFY